ncbi:MAG: SRPBCC family protein [Bacillota bacterium]|jgi:ribosome-associated toxin RatA of RatAB toxin-antitoxin module
MIVFMEGEVILPFVEVTKEINASPEEVYMVAKDMESYPNFMKNVVKITTLERGDAYTVTKWDTRLQGKPIIWTERDEFDDEVRRIDYRLVKGDLKKFEGAWTFEEIGSKTLVKLTVDFELGIPMFASLVNPIAVLTVKNNCESMLEGIKSRVESAKK